MNGVGSNDKNYGLVGKVLVGVICAIFSALLTIALRTDSSNSNLVARAEAQAMVEKAEARSNDRIDAISSSNEQILNKLDKLAEDLARTEAQVDIILHQLKKD